MTLLQERLPATYLRAPATELHERIAEAKARLGERLTILGHHYQRDDVIRYADFTGDSLKLAQLSQSRPEADYIVFCGVHFMAEGADMLSRDDQAVILPDLSAGCSMADMAPIEDVEDCWATLNDLVPEQRLFPLTYVNSAAAVKAHVGRHGGMACTSGNAETIIGHALSQADKLVFFPDQHLGRNVSFQLGVPLDEMIVWDPSRDLGGNTEAAIDRARVILWRGHCSVHSRMGPELVDHAKAKYPGVRVLVHPEVPFETVQQADLAGSTEFIIRQVRQAPAGSVWAIGTEQHLVHRLAKQHPEQTIVPLDDCNCMCATMFRISPAHLCWVLEELVDGHVPNRIQVDPDTARWAVLALDRMLELS